jgi:deazaflavin-dependent oxidoreductase (nitroreductase family)
MMTSQPVRGNMSGSPAVPEPRAKTLRWQGAANRVMRGMLRTPLLAQAMGSKLVTLQVTGRKSGRRYNIPVAYTRDGGDLLIGTPFGWGKNLRTGEPLPIRLKGRRRQADVRVYASEAEVTTAYAAMTRDNKQFAKFNQVSFDAGGNPEPEDLRAAWLGGARAFRLTPR